MMWQLMSGDNFMMKEISGPEYCRTRSPVNRDVK